jgi:hypothetical protein
VATARGPSTVYRGSVRHVHPYVQWCGSRGVVQAVTFLVICCGLAACGDETGSNGVTASRRAVAKATIGTAVRALPTAQVPRRAQPAAEGARVNKAAFRQTVTKFDGCLRRSGVTVASSTTNSGLALNINGIDAKTTRFEAAWAKCRRSVDLGRANFYLPAAGKRKNGRAP